MGSPPDDRTARARIRDEALRLFAAHGPDAVTVRDIAAAAGVSAALVVRHYGSKDGLREAVDGHVVAVFETVLDEVVHPGGSGPVDPGAAPSLAEAVRALLPDDSSIPAYLGRMLLSGDRAGAAVFARLHAASRDALAGMVHSGLAAPGEEPAMRAAFLLVNDLGVLMLRQRLQEVLGVDPLSADGLRRWGAEVLSIYRSGLRGTPADP